MEETPTICSMRTPRGYPLTCGLVGARKGHKKEETAKMFEALGDPIFVIDGEDGSVDSVSFTVLGKPKAKARPRFSKRSGHVHNPRTETDASENFKAALRQLLELNPGDATIFGSKSVKVTTVAKFERAASHFKRGGIELRAAAPQDPTGDVDNLLKFVMDAMNEIAYDDDKQVRLASTGKDWGEPFQTEVRVERYYE